MKKKPMKKTVKKVSARKAVRRVSRVSRTSASSAYGAWDKDRSMLLMLAAGTIILVVIGMYMAGWL